MTGATLLLRQVNPSWIQDGSVSSQAFRPTPKDKKLLSVYDRDKISPQDSWTHFTIRLGFASNGVQAVSVDECTSLSLTARPEPTEFPEHAVVDFQEFSETQIKNKAKRLRAAAAVRGWLYQP